MATTAEIVPGFILQCQGPEPENPDTRGIEVRIGFSISAEGGKRSITCNHMVFDSDWLPRCNLLNNLGVPSRNKKTQTGEEILRMITEPSLVIQDSRKLDEFISEDVERNQVPTTLVQSTLPLCRIAFLVVI